MKQQLHSSCPTLYPTGTKTQLEWHCKTHLVRWADSTCAYVYTIQQLYQLWRDIFDCIAINACMQRTDQSMFSCLNLMKSTPHGCNECVFASLPLFFNSERSLFKLCTSTSCGCKRKSRRSRCPLWNRPWQRRSATTCTLPCWQNSRRSPRSLPNFAHEKATRPSFEPKPL